MEKFNNIPQHVAVIMDGNRRWAKEHKLGVIDGHKYVANHVLEPLVEHASHIGIKFITFWAFSTENWRRDPQEVKGILSIFRRAIVDFGEKMHKKGIRIRMIGDLTKFPNDIQKEVNRLVDLTKKNTRITVIFALNYGGRDEIMRAMNKAISYELLASLKLRRSASAIRQKKDQGDKDFAESWELTAESYAHFLDTSGIPDPDLIIRTSGEQRLSGFLMWQSEYSELYFPDWYMPEFTPERLDEAVAEFNKRKRRFGR